MKAPGVLVFNTPEIRRALLSGMLRGDGGVHHGSGKKLIKKNGKEYSCKFNYIGINYYSINKMLLQQAVMMSQSLGLMPTLKSENEMRFWGLEHAKTLGEMLSGAKNRKIQRYTAAKKRVRRTSSFADHDDFYTVRVKSVQEIKAEDLYSMEVEGTNTFVTSYGIAVHNCLPVYPYLLLNHVKKEYGLIRKAREVNDYMPSHVAGLVKGLKPKTVTIFGIAYLRDTNEYRFSPAIELAKLLAKDGLAVRLCDPHMDQKVLAKLGKPVSVEEGLKSDVLVFAVDHSEFKGLETKIPKTAKVIDAKRMINAARVNGEYIAIGGTGD